MTLTLTMEKEKRRKNLKNLQRLNQMMMLQMMIGGNRKFQLKKKLNSKAKEMMMKMTMIQMMKIKHKLWETLNQMPLMVLM